MGIERGGGAGVKIDDLSLPGCGAFDHHSQGVGNLIISLDFMLRVAETNL